jgi:hypothetical protein
MTSGIRIPPRQRVLAFVCIVPLVNFLVVLLAGLLRTGYDPVSQYIGELAVGPAGWIQSANYLVMAVAMFAFALILRRTIRYGPGANAAPLFLAGFAFCLLAAAVVPDHVFGSSLSRRGAIFIVSSAAMAWLAGAALVTGLRSSLDRWTLWAAASVVCSSLLLAFVCLKLTGAGTLSHWIGLVQRLTVFGAWLWISAFAHLLATLR